MLSQSGPIGIILVFGTLVCLLFVGFIFVFVYRYQQKMIQHQQDILQKDEANKLTQLQVALLAQEREQRRIAQELHDGVGANLSGVILGLKAAIATQDSQGLKEMVDELHQTIAQVRSISHNLIPRMLDDIGFDGVLNELCALVNKSGVMRASLTMPDDLPELTVEHQLLLYRIIQELVHNAMKHAQASHIEVLLQYANGIYCATVTDNGCGFDTQGLDFKRGIGLKNIDNRAQLLKADFYIKSKPGSGTTATVKFKHP